MVYHTTHTISILWGTGKAKEENKVVRSNTIFLAESLPALSGIVLPIPLRAATRIKNCCDILMRAGAPLASALPKAQI